MACKFCTPYKTEPEYEECQSFPFVSSDSCYTDSANIEYLSCEEAGTSYTLMTINFGNPYSTIDIPISYCPFCGEKLREQKNNLLNGRDTAEKMPCLIDSDFSKCKDGEYRTDFGKALFEIEETAEQLYEAISLAIEQREEQLRRCNLW